jgi:Phycobilisome degradation protein nblA
MNISTRLSFEQEFNLRIYEAQVKLLDLPTVQNLLMQSLHQSMVKDNLYQEMIKNGI